MRIFTCDFPILEDGFIASIAIKRDTECFDVDMHLIIYDEELHQKCDVICTNRTYPIDSPGQKNLTKVSENDLKEIHQLLKTTNQKCISKYSPINDWETRFYYICLDGVRGKIVDIGVRMWNAANTKTSFSCKYNNILIGAMAFHNGVFSNMNLRDIPKVIIKF